MAIESTARQALPLRCIGVSDMGHIRWHEGVSTRCQEKPFLRFAPLSSEQSRQIENLLYGMGEAPVRELPG